MIESGKPRGFQFFLALQASSEVGSKIGHVLAEIGREAFWYAFPREALERGARGGERMAELRSKPRVRNVDFLQETNQDLANTHTGRRSCYACGNSLETEKNEKRRRSHTLWWYPAPLTPQRFSYCNQRFVLAPHGPSSLRGRNQINGTEFGLKVPSSRRSGAPKSQFHTGVMKIIRNCGVILPPGSVPKHRGFRCQVSFVGGVDANV